MEFKGALISVELSSIISVIKLLHCNPNFEVKFVSLQANMIAHTLARVTSYWTRCMFISHIPRCIELIVLNEMCEFCLLQKEEKNGCV